MTTSPPTEPQQPTAGDASPALVAAAETALAGCSKRIVVIEHGGTAYVIKRLTSQPRSMSQSLLLRWLVKRVIGQTLPLATLRLAPCQSRADFEATRLAAMARAGIRVPRVVHRGRDYLLLEHCGESIAMQLQGWSVETWRAELPRLAGQLGAFHEAGQWHGAAQIKNLTRRDGLDYRIDFEEPFGDSIPLAAAQALDLVLFLNSICLRCDIDEAEARGLLPRLLEAYFTRHPDRQVEAMLARAVPWATTLARPAAWIRRLQRWGRPRKGILRLIILTEVLSAYLNNHSAAARALPLPSGSK